MTHLVMGADRRCFIEHQSIGLTALNQQQVLW